MFLDWKKSKAPMSVRALRQAAGLGPTAGYLTTTQDVPPAPPVVKAPPTAAATLTTFAPSPPLVAMVQEVSPTIVEAIVLAAQAESVVVSSSTVAAPLLSVGVVITSAPTVLLLSSLASVVMPIVVFEDMASPSSSLRPRISLDHLYTSSDADSMWGATYKLEQNSKRTYWNYEEARLARLRRSTQSIGSMGTTRLVAGSRTNLGKQVNSGKRRA